MPRVQYDNVAIAPSTRTAIVAAVNCTGVVLEQTDLDNNVLVWDAASGGNFKTLAAGTAYAIKPGEGPVQDVGRAHRMPGFRAGETICWIEAIGGTGPIAVEYLI